MSKYRTLRQRLRQDETGLLAFEWVLLLTVLIIGIIGGMAVLRDTLVVKYGNLVGAVGKLDQSCGYSGCPYLENNGTTVTNNTFTDTRAGQTSVVTMRQPQ